VIRIGEGKYRIGENGTIIFIRVCTATYSFEENYCFFLIKILRNHVMVRVGGGWDTLENYLNKHDPCRRSGGKSIKFYRFSLLNTFFYSSSSSQRTSSSPSI
jgi:hypothetical protein